MRVFYDDYTHILMVVGDRLLKQKLKEMTQWYTFANANVENFFGIKLNTTTLLTNEKCTTDKQQVNWESVVIKSD